MKISTSILGVAGALTAFSFAIATPSNANAWGDNIAGGRPSYTIEQINAGELKDTITFNSISNGKIGDEKNFVGARALNSTDWLGNSIDVKDGETYKIRLYVHNNSPKGEAAIAKGVKTTFSLPTTVAKSHNIIGYIDSSNAYPTRYWDAVDLKSDNNFYIEYVKGSAKYENANGTFALSDSVITTGATIGFNGLNGEIPGCYEFDGVVTIEVKVVNALSTKVKQQVRVKGTKEWADTTDAKVGDEVEYQIYFQNLSNDQVDNVMIRDVLPTNVEYVKGTTKIYNAAYPNWGEVNSDDIVTTGINIGSYKADTDATIRFTVKVVNKDLTGCGAIDQLVNWASSTVNGEVAKDNTVVRVKEGTCVEKPTPKPGELPKTGASDILPVALGAGAVTAALLYIASRKKLM